MAASVASAMEDDFEMEGEEETWSIVGLLTWPLRTVVKWIIMAMIKAATGGSPKGNIDKYADKLAKENLAKERELEREEIEALEKRSAIFRVLEPALYVAKFLLLRYFGCVVRCLIFVHVQLKTPSMTTRERRAFHWPRLGHALNTFLNLFWPTLRRIVSDALRDTVRETVNELLAGMDHAPIKSLVTLECNLGRRALIVESATLTSSYSGFDFLDLDLVVSFEGDTFEIVSDISVAGDAATPQLTATIKGLSFHKEQLRLKIGPLSTGLPGFGALQVAFARPPSTVVLEASVTALESLPFLVNFSLINRFLETHIVQHIIAEKFVWPKAIVVPTKVWAPNVGLIPEETWWDATQLEAYRAKVKGTLKVEVLGARVDDFAADATGCYVRGRIGSSVARGDVVLNATGPKLAPDDAPRALATLVFPVATDVESLDLEVREDAIGEDRHMRFHRTDALLGSAKVDFDEIPPYRANDVTLALDTPENFAGTAKRVIEISEQFVATEASELILKPTRSCLSCVWRRRKPRAKTLSSRAASEARQKAIGIHSPSQARKTTALERTALGDGPASPARPGERESEGEAPGPNDLRLRLEWTPTLSRRDHHQYRAVVQAGFGLALAANLAFGVQLEHYRVFNVGFRFVGHGILIAVVVFLTMPVVTCCGMYVLRAATRHHDAPTPTP